MLARVVSAVLVGVDASLVEVQVDLSHTGLPGTQTVGLPGTVVRESQERVRIAIRNSELAGKPARVTVNLAPADLPKQGSVLDLAVALAILLADRGAKPLQGWLVVGELALDGTLRPIAGALPMTLAASAAGLRGILLPEGNANEAAAVGSISVVGVQDLRMALKFLTGEIEIQATAQPEFGGEEAAPHGEDLSGVRGQARARRALEVAAAGGHNLIFIGPPGAGKTMLARRLRTILPRLTVHEAIEVTRVASVAGLVPPGSGLVRVRPFRTPHHSITPVGLIGGGADLRPGEVSIASEGVLFLDELPEFGRSLLEQLRQPIEEGRITLVRHRQRVTLPSRVILVAGMNPCLCGYRGHPVRRCGCTPVQVARYMGRISGPLWDRFDIVCEVPPVPVDDLAALPRGESSLTVRRRVEAARAFQEGRTGRPFKPNARMTVDELPPIASLPEDAAGFLKASARQNALSARAVHRVLRVARTVADLDAEEGIKLSHIAEALQYRIRVETG